VSVDPKSHIEQYGVKVLDSGTLRNLRMIAQRRLDHDTAIRDAIPDEANLAVWDEATAGDAADNKAAIAACTAELNERGHE
jgi:hypothetical protein